MPLMKNLYFFSCKEHDCFPSYETHITCHGGGDKERNHDKTERINNSNFIFARNHVINSIISMYFLSPQTLGQFSSIIMHVFPK